MVRGTRQGLWVRSTLFSPRPRNEAASHAGSQGRRRRPAVNGCAEECGGHRLHHHQPRSGAGQSRASWERPFQCRAGRRLGRTWREPSPGAPHDGSCQPKGPWPSGREKWPRGEDSNRRRDSAWSSWLSLHTSPERACTRHQLLGPRSGRFSGTGPAFRLCERTSARRSTGHRTPDRLSG